MINDMQEMEQELRAKYPDATRTMKFRGPPKDPKGEWWLDVEQGGRAVTVQWSPRRGFGVSTTADAAYGEGPDETFATREEAVVRVLELLKAPANGERIAKFFAAASLERMALSIAYGVFLQARDTLQAGLAHWLSGDDSRIQQPPCTRNLDGLVWRKPGSEPAQSLEFFEFYDVNRELFISKARALNTIVQSLGG